MFNTVSALKLSATFSIQHYGLKHLVIYIIWLFLKTTLGVGRTPIIILNVSGEETEAQGCKEPRSLFLLASIALSTLLLPPLMSHFCPVWNIPTSPAVLDSSQFVPYQTPTSRDKSEDLPPATKSLRKSRYNFLRHQIPNLWKAESNSSIWAEAPKVMPPQSFLLTTSSSPALLTPLQAHTSETSSDLLLWVQRTWEPIQEKSVCWLGSASSNPVHWGLIPLHDQL